MVQETQTGALYQPREVGWEGRWEGTSKGRECMYTYVLFVLKFDRKQQNYIKQLSFNKKNKFLKNAGAYPKSDIRTGAVVKEKYNRNAHNSANGFLVN